MNLGRALLFAMALGVVVTLCGCPPPEEPAQPNDNTECNFEGYTEKSVRGHLRMSFDYEGGDCRCDCDRIPLDLLCHVEP